MLHITILILSSILVLPSLALASSARRCNGRPEYCTRRYSDMTFVGAHDSPLVGDSMADNQAVPLASQLAMGVRFLQGQAHDDGSRGKGKGKGSQVIKICHTMCLLRNAGPLRDVLGVVRTFLDANPDEVVTLLLTNPDGIRSEAFGEVFRGAGLDEYAFEGNGKALGLGSWPTLGEMIDAGKRLVVFVGRSLPFLVDHCRLHMVH